MIALSTAYVERSAQVGLDLWYFRTFVSRAHRNTHIATQLTMHNRDLLERRFTGGEDTRAAGVAFELQNEGMRKYINTAIWQPVDFIFVGDNERGEPVRVHYFPGARVPLCTAHPLPGIDFLSAPGETPPMKLEGAPGGGSSDEVQPLVR